MKPLTRKFRTPLLVASIFLILALSYIPSTHAFILPSLFANNTYQATNFQSTSFTTSLGTCGASTAITLVYVLAFNGTGTKPIVNRATIGTQGTVGDTFAQVYQTTYTYTGVTGNFTSALFKQSGVYIGTFQIIVYMQGLAQFALIGYDYICNGNFNSYSIAVGAIGSGNTRAWSLTLNAPSDYVAVFGYFQEGSCVAITDAVNLTLLTNGCQIWNGSHQLRASQGVSGGSSGWGANAGSYQWSHNQQSLITAVDVTGVTITNPPNQPTTNSTALLNFLVPFIIVCAPAFIIWGATQKIFGFLMGATIGAAIGASTNLIPVYVPLLFVILIGLYVWKGGKND